MESGRRDYHVLLGTRIRTLRNLKGWTQEELGERAKVNYKFVGEIERGQQNPSFAVLVKIARALEVGLPELFRFERRELTREEMEERINILVKSLHDEDLERMLAVLRMLYPAH